MERDKHVRATFGNMKVLINKKQILKKYAPYRF